MHVLFVANGFPNEDKPAECLFYQEQAFALRARGLKVGVIAVDARLIGDLARPRVLVDVVRGYERFDAVGIRAGVLAQFGSETVADRIVAAYEKVLSGR